MNIYSQKVMFSDKQLDLIKAGETLMKQYQYIQNPTANKHLEKFSQGDYRENNEIFRDSLFKECYSVSNLDPEKVNLAQAWTFSSFERMHFSVIETIIARTTSKSNVEMFMGNLAEVRNMADGDSMNIDIKAKNVYLLSKVARGMNSSHIQRRFGQNVTLTPSTRQCTIGFEEHQIISGRIDYGRELALATEGIKTSMLIEVQALLFGSSNPIGNKLIENTYTESAFRALIQKVQAKNGSANVITAGTDIALSAILPTETAFLQPLGLDYMKQGYVINPFGTKSLVFPQAVDSQDDLILPNDKIVVFTAGVDRPIKIGMGGNVKIINTNGDNKADRMRTYTVEVEYDVQLASDAHVGIQDTATA